MPGDGIKAAIEQAGEAGEPLESAILRLAALSLGDYEQCRKHEAKNLNVRTDYLDKEVEGARDKTGEKAGKKSPIRPDFDPWPTPVDGADLLALIVSALQRYIVLSQHAAEATALWIVHTHCFDCWRHTPRLAIKAPTMGAGKSTLIDVAAEMVQRAMTGENMSTAVIFRAIDKFQPTLLADEVDSFLHDHDDMRGVLNAGHKAGATVWRCEGDNNDLKAFEVFTPVALAGIGRLPGTLEDRSINIRLQRKKKSEAVSDFRGDRAGHLRDIGRQCARWTADNRDALGQADPVMPDGIHNRRADNWRALLSIADTAGGDWPERARAVASAMTSGADEAESNKVELLHDIRAIFESSHGDKIWSKDLLVRLHELEDRPWADYRNGKALSARQLGDMLRSFGIASNQFCFPGSDKQARGYRKEDFKDILERYPPNFAVMPSPSPENLGLLENPSVTPGRNVTEGNHKKPQESGASDGMTEEKGGNGGMDVFSPDLLDPPDFLNRLKKPESDSSEIEEWSA